MVGELDRMADEAAAAAAAAKKEKQKKKDKEEKKEKKESGGGKAAGGGAAAAKEEDSDSDWAGECVLCEAACKRVLCGSCPAARGVRSLGWVGVLCWLGWGAVCGGDACLTCTEQWT